MGLITAVRSQVPVATPSAPPAPEATARLQPAAAAGPVTETQRLTAPQAAAPMGAAVASRLAERDETAHPAAATRAAADAAREAYIRASRAAGVNPLPLPRF